MLVVRRAVEVEVVTGARGLCSILVPVARRPPRTKSLLALAPRGALEGEIVMVPAARVTLVVEVLTSARGLGSLLVPAARGTLEVEVVTGARGLCSLLVLAARGALEVGKLQAPPFDQRPPPPSTSVEKLAR